MLGEAGEQENEKCRYDSIWLLSLVLDLRPFRHCSFMGHEEYSVKVFQLIVKDNTQ